MNKYVFFPLALSEFSVICCVKDDPLTRVRKRSQNSLCYNPEKLLEPYINFIPVKTKQCFLNKCINPASCLLPVVAMDTCCLASCSGLHMDFPLELHWCDTTVIVVLGSGTSKRWFGCWDGGRLCLWEHIITKEPHFQLHRYHGSCPKYRRDLGTDGKEGATQWLLREHLLVTTTLPWHLWAELQSASILSPLL